MYHADMTHITSWSVTAHALPSASIKMLWMNHKPMASRVVRPAFCSLSMYSVTYVTKDCVDIKKGVDNTKGF